MERKNESVDGMVLKNYGFVTKTINTLTVSKELYNPVKVEIPDKEKEKKGHDKKFQRQI